VSSKPGARPDLESVGRDLTGNPRVRVRDVEVLSRDWYVLRKTTFDYRHADGRWSSQSRETYDRGNGAAILLYDPRAATVALTRQFRFPAYVNGHPDGMLIEVPAGLLDHEDPETAIRREAEEETGIRVGAVTRLFEVYMSPGSVTERLTFFAAPYRHGERAGRGGGVAIEGEEIELLEPTLEAALEMIERGEIADAKTIMLLQWARAAGVVPC
jgi:nudix-type nucleoside diphosphatase (YffH/AdpP family)